MDQLIKMYFSNEPTKKESLLGTTRPLPVIEIESVKNKEKQNLPTKPNSRPGRKY